MTACHYCRANFERHELRPYGPDRALICHPCGVAPEHAAETARQFDAALEAAAAAGAGVVLITPEGPVPGRGLS